MLDGSGLTFPAPLTELPGSPGWAAGGGDSCATTGTQDLLPSGKGWSTCVLLTQLLTGLSFGQDYRARCRGRATDSTAAVTLWTKVKLRIVNLTVQVTEPPVTPQFNTTRDLTLLSKIAKALPFITRNPSKLNEGVEL